MKRLTSDNKMLGYELMKAYPNISCFSTTRHGGCSKGNYASFNCNGYCGDEAEDVNRNRELLRSLLPGESVELVIPHQTHSDHVKVVDTIQVNTELEGVDALVTDIPGYCLCVSTADCVPVLLYDTRKKVVAAIHAGWRGTVARPFGRGAADGRACCETGNGCTRVFSDRGCRDCGEISRV